MPVVNCEPKRCLTKVGTVELLSEYGLFLAKIVTVVLGLRRLPPLLSMLLNVINASVRVTGQQSQRTV